MKKGFALESLTHIRSPSIGEVFCMNGLDRNSLRNQECTNIADEVTAAADIDQGVPSSLKGCFNRREYCLTIGQ